ncbi:MarR family winged helix-turn-helix transcriptional regulator [Protaetiibacter mangrovi]|uniref:MarR family winged helix-turn-helix transcriptional regulator n=1 Tax=Protaetiibacter mangrovi TaxID=2970926 RepID=A0ABT1ZDS4_9MICO|nr:MarR family transcriptional regulator [Protaetiibacter mangrovi]MCS0498852.1 MarR family winged helix-turn-helix transcriptional regulator [Protaetiibacter mangrovi]TPX00793.1 winged helix-turn-helix transcriptional regulator [Schumannella luteola]
MSEAPGARPPFSPVISLLTVSAVWEARLDAELRELGLTTRKYGLLAHILGMPGISFSELARRSQITVQSAHTAVRSLVDAGYAVDATAHAGAASVLQVTAAGHDVLARAQRAVELLDAEFVAGAPALSVALERPHEDALPADLQAD